MIALKLCLKVKPRCFQFSSRKPYNQGVGLGWGYEAEEWGGRAVGALRTALSCSSCLLELVSTVLCFVHLFSFGFIIYFFFLLIEVSTAFSLAFQLSPCVYVLGKNEWLDLMRGG